MCRVSKNLLLFKRVSWYMYKAIGLITLGKHWKYKCLKYI